MVVRGQEVVLRCPSYSPAVKWARLECKSYKIPEPATEIEPNDQVPSFLLSAEATPVDAIANAIRANKIKTDLEPSYPAAIMPPKTGRQAMIRNWRELVWLVVFVFLFGAALLANVSDRPLAEHRGMWVTQALR